MKLTKLIVSLFLCYAVAFLGGVITYTSIPTWYAMLHKPFFTPPNIVFGPIWLLLYTLMGIALYSVWLAKAVGKNKSRALSLFGLQLVLNLLWSYVFFGLHFLLVGLVVIGSLLWVIIALIRRFLPISRTAAYLLVPYAIWVGFALLLNMGIVFMN